MKIAIFHNLPSGGAKRALYEWTRRLANEHVIDVFSLGTADHTYCDIRPFASRYKIYEFVTRRLYTSPYGRLNQFQRWRDLGDLENLNFEIAAHINNGGYDVLFANTCIYTFIPALLQCVQIPSVYYLHEPFGRRFVRKFERPYLKKGGWREVLNRLDPLLLLYQQRLASIQKRSIRKVTRLLSNSRFTSERIQVEFKVDAEISRYGVDLSGFHPMNNGSSREDFVISVGEMTPRKGFDFIVESLGKISSDRRPVLKVASNMVNGDELSYVKYLAEQNGVKLDVLVGLSVDELRSLYSRARLCVYAPVMEPFGLVPLESMACGTPVVGVKEGGIQESVVHEQTGLLVDRDVRQFAAAVERLLENPDLVAVYGRNGRNNVLRNWTWDGSAAKLQTHLSEVSRLGR